MDNELLIITLFTIIFVIIYKYTVNNSSIVPQNISKENMTNDANNNIGHVFNVINNTFESTSNKNLEKLENTVDPRKVEDPLDDIDTINMIKELAQEQSEKVELSYHERVNKQTVLFNKSSNDYIVRPDYKNIKFEDKSIGQIIDQAKIQLDANISNEQLNNIQSDYLEQENKELEKYYNPVFTSYDKNFDINNNFTIDRSFNATEFPDANQTIQPYSGKIFGALY